MTRSSAEFERRSSVPVSAEAVYDWHMRPGAFQRLAPPWEAVGTEGETGPITEGSRLTIVLGKGPLKLRWVAEHDDIVPGRRFRDTQVRGPFAEWVHSHRFEPEGADTSVLTDRIRYRLPLGRLGQLVAGAGVRRRLDRLFDFRHRRTLSDLKRHSENPRGSTMNVAITGASGLVGSNLSAFLTTGGHGVKRLVRRAASSADEVSWDPAAGSMDAAGLEGLDAVVHLAGENIGDKRWSDTQKRKIVDSRVAGTRLVAETLAGLKNKPSTLVCASAVGYYGDRGDELLDETSSKGSGFLPETCDAWEKAADPARQAGIRVVHVRTGLVLSPEGGALKKMLLPFKLGAGGKIGSGQQYMSWIAIDDLVAVFHRALTDEKLEGPVNGTAPNPVRNIEFTKALGRVLGRPTIAPLPGFAVKVLFGEMGEDLLLGGARVRPAALEGAGFEFDYPEVEQALRHVLGK